MYKNYFKRLLDIIFSSLGIFIFALPALIIAMFIKIDDFGPVFFKQKRVGINKKSFLVYKFRSMNKSTPHDTPTHLLENPTQYYLQIGGFIRKYSIDEIPQLYNILKGDMSIVGPRPCLWNQYDLIAERDKYGANNIKPGLTGWAQINGRDDLGIKMKAKLDGVYVEKQSFRFDCKCLLRTVGKVIRHDGVIEEINSNIDKKSTECEEITKI